MLAPEQHVKIGSVLAAMVKGILKLGMKNEADLST